jgi:hypothetical protein
MSDIILNHLDTIPAIADFLAQSLCFYPDDIQMKYWIRDNRPHEYSENDFIKLLNRSSLELCFSGLYVNFHVLLCKECRDKLFDVFPKTMIFKEKYNVESIISDESVTKLSFPINKNDTDD